LMKKHAKIVRDHLIDPIKIISEVYKEPVPP